MILSPQQAAAAGLSPAGRAGARPARRALEPRARARATSYSIDSQSLTIGRGRDNDVSIAGDEYASTRHARFEPRRDGVYVEDIGSTNGTFVERHPPDARAPPGARRRRARRRDRPEVRAVRLGQVTQATRPTRAASGATTRTRSSATRRSSRSPTAWAARRPARSPRRSRPARCASGRREAAARSRVVELVQEANRRVHERALERRGRRPGWARR